MILGAVDDTLLNIVEGITGCRGLLTVVEAVEDYWQGLGLLQDEGCGID